MFPIQIASLLNSATIPEHCCSIFSWGYTRATASTMPPTPLSALAFKSTFFPYLYDLLERCGVVAPRFCFSNHVEHVSKTYQAGTLGGVRWGYHDIFAARALFRYGLPSSNILDSVPELIQTLLPANEDRRILFLSFLLGYLCADGTVSWI
ncbi:uncharacterized protein BYT42DRAFT_557550 [Radiomyces spectabilis]|uniref:uncharacterized protein n=1 Tax=Radiomyces spectabilis TaxID=64574 RepID=UPI00221F01BC|nr:uncharacterized protein BYT42DRAFT_557550 [Radiomyces spectabilis]KAI8391633.1 hypothetical protein BYT42DRAFT_557550 [Radiomyces spectabilis]